MGDSEAARAANIAHYATGSASHASPHLTHMSVWTIYTRMVDRALADLQPGPSILDLGAGDGAASRPWIEAGAQLLAVDSSGEQLRLLRERYPAAVTFEADCIEFVQTTNQTYDVVSHVSMLHHIPDYLALLKASARVVRSGGSLLTFQDPLRYDYLPRFHFLAAQALYIPWRLTEGDVLRGIGRRIRRSRGIYLAHDVDDQGEYHVQRNGVDSDAILTQLKRDFHRVELVIYFSSHARLSQWIGQRLRIRSTFGVIATGRF
jgi:SAM-dependent methyltransferase